MPQTVEQRIDQVLVAEQLVPLIEIKRRRDDGRDAVVTLVDETEEGVGLFRLDRQIVDLVDDEGLTAAQTLQQAASGAVGEGCVEVVEQILRIVEAAAVAIEAGFAQNADGYCRLACPGLAGEHDVVGTAQEATISGANTASAPEPATTSGL